MSTAQLENTLRDLPRVGTLIKDRGYRQVWRFEFGGNAYFLKFYPRGEKFRSRDWWRRKLRGSPASNEFQRLQTLQKAKVPAPRAVALLVGFVLDGRKGDAVLLQAIEPSIPLDQLLNDEALAGRHPNSRRQIADQLIDLVYQLGVAGLGHGDLHLGNFLLSNGKLFLIDAYAVRKGGLRTADVMLLGASVARFATTTDLLRGWRKLVGDAPIPTANPLADRIWNSQLARSTRDNRYFGRLSAAAAAGGWDGIFFKQTKYPRRWSAVSRLDVTEADWQAAFPQLLEQLTGGGLAALKTSRSADVFETTLRLGGQDVPVIIKRPYRPYWHRYVSEVGRGARARRAWRKAWHLVIRDLPTAWPVAFFERRQFGYVVDTFIVFERVPGPTLWKVDLEALTSGSREMLFRRVGRLLRLLERYGFAHFDAKASNWIVRPDEATGPAPVLVDVDGIRRRRWPALGVRRLLRSLLDRRQYAPDDSLALCKGYAPYARLEPEVAAEEVTEYRSDGVPE